MNKELSRIDINGVTYYLLDENTKATAVTQGRYNSSNQRIELLNANNNVVSFIDATNFIKDGMVSNVSIVNGNLVITFNTDAGKSPISIPLTSIFNPSNYYQKSEIDSKLAEKQSEISNLESTIGYYECSSEASSASKTIAASNYVLGNGGSMKVKMTNANTANNATLNINSTGAKPLYYDGKRASSNNTWEAGETVEVYYDGTNFYANNVAGGSSSGVFDVSKKFPTSGVEGGSTYTLELALSVLNANLSANKKEGGMQIRFVDSSDNKYVQYRYMETDAATAATFTNVANWQGVDKEPVADSHNLAESGAVKKAINDLLTVYLQAGYYVDNTIGNVAFYNQSESYSCEKIPALVGQTFVIAGIPSNNARLWATLDADRKVVRCSEYTSLQRQETVTIEEGEAYLVYNTSNNAQNKKFQLIDGSVIDYIVKLDRRNNEDIYSKIQIITNKNTEQDESLASINNILSINTDISSFGYGTYTDDNSVVNSGLHYGNTFTCMKIRVRKGMKLSLTLKGSSGVRVYYTADANNMFIRRSDLNVTLNKYELTIEDNEEYLFVSSGIASFVPKVTLIQNISKTLVDDISVSSDNKESLDIISSFYPIMSDVIPREVKNTESSFWEYGSLGGDWYVGGSHATLVNVRPIKLIKGKYQIRASGDSTARYALYDKHFNKVTNAIIENTIITVSDDFQYLYVCFLDSVVANISILRLCKIKKDVKLNDSDRNDIDGLSTVSQSYADGYSILDDTTFKTSDFTSNTTPFIPIKRGAKIDVFAWNTTTPNQVQGVRVYKDEKFVKFIPFSDINNEASIVSRTGATHSTASEYKFHFGADYFDADGMSIKIVNAAAYAKLPGIRIVSYGSSFVLDTNDVHSDLFILGDLGSVYSRALPINVEGTAGEPNAMYSILAPITRYFNIRFKFRITDAIINSAKTQAPFWAANTSYLIGDYVWYDNKSYKCTTAHTSGSTFDSSKFTADYINIFKGAGSYIRAIPSVGGLSQFKKTYTYNGSSHTSYYGTFNGGIAFDSIANINNRKFLNNIGDFAFSVRYVGNGSAATARNTGSAFILSVDGVEVANLAYSTYTTMSALYEAIAAITDFEVDYNEIENRTPQELAIFPESQLVSTFYGNLSGVKPTAENSEEYTDNPPLLVPYAVSNRWNQAEIVGIDDNIYVVVNGITSSFSRAQTSVAKLIFGGDCGVLFKDVEIDLSSVRDAELVNNYGLNTPMIISSVNPYTMIWEGHGMVDSIIDADNYPGDEMSCSTDRIQRVTEASMAKGYIPVSLKDIVGHYKYGKSLPKRCFTFVFDDYRFGNFLNLKNRSVFTRFNLKASLAVISTQDTPIYYNGQEITVEKAVAIGKNAGFECYSHTRNHRYMESIRPSDYANEARLDLYDGDEKGINPNILIFPYGDDNTYLLDVLKFIGLEAGIEVEVGNPYCNNPYSLVRQEIGVRSTISSVLIKIV